MKKKTTNTLKEQADRLKKAVQRLLSPPPTSGYALQPVRQHNRFPR